MKKKLHVIYLHFLPIDVQCTNSEVDPNGVLLLLNEYARLEALDHAGLPHIRVPNQDDFKEKVESVFNLWICRLHGKGNNVRFKRKH